MCSVPDCLAGLDVRQEPLKNSRLPTSAPALPCSGACLAQLLATLYASPRTLSATGPPSRIGGRGCPTSAPGCSGPAGGASCQHGKHACLALPALPGLGHPSALTLKKKLQCGWVARAGHLAGSIPAMPSWSPCCMPASVSPPLSLPVSSVCQLCRAAMRPALSRRARRANIKSNEVLRARWYPLACWAVVLLSILGVFMTPHASATPVIDRQARSSARRALHAV